MIQPFQARDRGDGLALRRVAHAQDIARVAAFDAAIHGAESESTWRTWMQEHPFAHAAHWLFIEEVVTSRVVASLCLLPWQLRFAGISLPSAEMGVVGTLEQYRGRGLQRVLGAAFDELLRAEGYLLSHIQGIPYFYRQFGYEYAVPLEAWWRLELHMLATAPPVAGLHCRPATLQDLPLLIAFYDEAAQAFDVAALRDAPTWAYLLGPALATETAAATWMVIDHTGTPTGYFRVAQQGFGEGLIVAETSELSADAALVALVAIADLARERGKPFVRLNLPTRTTLVRIARGLGAYDGNAYGWQVRLPDPAALFRALAPVFTQRVAASPYAGLSQVVVIDLYRQAFGLHFRDGHLAMVEKRLPGAPSDLALPPPLLAPLLLGYRSLAAMAPMYPDVLAAGLTRPLLDVLFPPLEAWLYLPY